MTGKPSGSRAGLAGRQGCGSYRGERRGASCKQPPAGGGHGARREHHQSRDRGGHPARQHRPQPGGAARGVPAAVLPGLPGGRGRRACGQQPGQAGGGQHHHGHSPGPQPGTGRGQQLALRHHQADQATGLGRRGGAQPRQPQPVRERRPHVRRDSRNAQRHERGRAPGDRPRPPPGQPPPDNRPPVAGCRAGADGGRGGRRCGAAWHGPGGIRPRGGAGGEQAEGHDGQAGGDVEDEVVGRGEDDEGGGRGVEPGQVPPPAAGGDDDGGGAPGGPGHVQAGHGGVQVDQGVGAVRVARAEDVVAVQHVGHAGHGEPGRGGRPGPEHQVGRGGGQHQRRAQRPERGGPAQVQPGQHERGDDEVQQPVVVAGRLGERRVDRGEVVEGWLDVQVHGPLGPPQLGGVRERGGAAGLDGQPHQGVAEVAGGDEGHLGRGGQPRPGQADPATAAGPGREGRSRPRRPRPERCAGHGATPAGGPLRAAGPCGDRAA